MLNALGRTLGFQGGSQPVRGPSEALAAVLDDSNNGTAAPVLDGDASKQLLEDTQLAKQKAEAEAEDAVSRLRVHQLQVSEWASERATDCASLLSLVDTLASSGLAAEHAELLRKLKATLETQQHEAQELSKEAKADAERQNRRGRTAAEAGMPDADGDIEMKRQREAMDEDEDDSKGEGQVAEAAQAPAELQDGQADVDEDSADEPAGLTAQPALLGASSVYAERARYIPMRLDHDERRLLRLLEAALNVSEYTDKVDILTWRNKTQRIHAQIKDICAILSGLVVAQDYRRGQQLIKDRTFQDNEEFFQAVFEVGRRYKIMNPDKMRSEYGKLMYMLMDSSDSHVQDLLEFKCVKPLKTVYSFLESKGALRVLDDPLMGLATAEIISAGRSRYDVQRDIKAKEKARETLAKRYSSSSASQEDILSAIYAFSDNNSYLLFNRDPVDRMIAYFKHHFSPEGPTDASYSLAIQGGRGGARLTHNHERQYQYVLQSLTLWREIMTDMFRLWYLAESDMLREGNSYRLCDTGQGLNRVQHSPQVGRAMQGILHRCQQSIGSWVGSSVVHLGDHNVPNALMFIDKYTQVPRILNPVVSVLDSLPGLYKDPKIRQYIDSAYGGLEECRLDILTDFCRHAFDGSGADNFFDAGSCIDGRLTSAWNWCQKLEKKHYYAVFRLAGFTGFDGDFK